MVRLFTAAEMRAADRLAADRGLPGLRLMENAGRAVAEVAAGMAGSPGAAPGPVVILAGKGNNGGDGLVAARHLARTGFDVEVVLAEPAGAFSGDAATNLDALLKGGSARPLVFSPGAPDIADTQGPPRAAIGPSALTRLLGQSSVIVDALLGTGAKGAPREPVATLISLLNATNATAVESPGAGAGAAGGPGGRPRPAVLAVDLPSGLDADSGRPAGPCVRADVTVTLGGVKVGLAMPEALPYRGRLYLAPIDIPEECLQAALVQPAAPAVHWLLPTEAAALLPARPVTGHKGTFGHVWVAAGSPGFTGAAVLAGLGALRAGAGLVTVACPEGSRTVVASTLPELLTLALPEGGDGRLAAAASAVLAEALGRWAAGRPALVVGPGLGATGEVRAFVSGLLTAAGGRLPAVLDADALNALALDGPGPVPGLLEPARGRAVVTPHPGEMARLAGRSVPDIQADRLNAALSAARTWGVVVVLKGAGTVVASPDGSAWVNATGNPGMATGGSGDVLAGAVGAFLAQGLAPLEAALLGVSAHGLAGDLATREVGSRGLLASDIACCLPRALDSLAAAGDYGPVPVRI